MRTLSIALRIIRQFRRDRRTLALIVVVPAVVLSLVGYLLQNTENNVSLLIVDQADEPNVARAFLERAAEQAGWDVESVGGDDKPFERIKDGDADAAVVFGSDGHVELIVRGSEPQKTQIVKRVASQALMIAAVLAEAPAGAGPPLEAPPELETRYVFGGPEFDTVDYQAPPLIGFFAFFFVFLLTTVSFLRERTGGTLERLMVTPAKRTELVLGYMLGFGLLAALQSVIILLVSLFVLRIDYAGNLALVFLLVITLTVAGVNLGIFLSTYARNELQAIQFIPLVIVPQGLLSGVIWAIEGMPRWLQGVAHVMPLTYSNRALRGVMLEGQGPLDGELLLNFGVLVAFAVFFVLLSSVTLRRYSD